MESTEISHIPVPLPHTHSLPHYQHPPQSGTFVTIDELTLTHHNPESAVYKGFTLDVVHSMSLNKRIMTCVYHYSITQSIFTAIKILFSLPIDCSLPKTPDSHWSFCFQSFTFTRMSVVGIIQYVAFSDLLLSLSNMHLFPPCFCLLEFSKVWFPHWRSCTLTQYILVYQKGIHSSGVH